MSTALDSASEMARAAIVTRDPNQIRELVTTTTAAIMADPDTRAALSDEAKVIARGLTSAASAVVASVDIGRMAKALGQSPASLAGEISMQVLGTGLQYMVKAAVEAGEMVPVVGQAINMAWSLFGVVGDQLNAAMAASAQARAEAAQKKRDLFLGLGRDRPLMMPNATGRQGTIVPADLFAWQDFYPRYRFGTNRNLYRPLVGAALIKLTESGLEPDPRPATGLLVYEPIGTGHDAVGTADYDTWLAALRKAQADDRLGIPIQRRRVFQLVRRAIETQRNVKGSDGGLSLWPIYADLLAEAFQKGWLTERALDDGIHLQISWVYGFKELQRYAEIAEHTYRPSLAVYGIIGIARQWSAETRPVYAQDVAEKEKTSSLIANLTRIAALQAAGQVSFTEADLAGVPEELRPKLGLQRRADFSGVFEAIRRKAGVVRARRARVALVGGGVAALALCGALVAATRR